MKSLLLWKTEKCTSSFCFLTLSTTGFLCVHLQRRWYVMLLKVIQLDLSHNKQLLYHCNRREVRNAEGWTDLSIWAKKLLRLVENFSKMVVLHSVLYLFKENGHRKKSICISKSYSYSQLSMVGVFYFQHAIGTYLLLYLLIQCSTLWQTLFFFFLDRAAFVVSLDSACIALRNVSMENDTDRWERNT